ncbi:MAG: hypothetical protein E3J65_06500 [Dehalococcoidia bacterium]|nr:MAG: hypothetical protein E3J65_06500 [Dehalococcoidia bacterium]
MTVEVILGRIDSFRKQCRSLLATVEASRTRVITVEESHRRIEGLSIKQDDLFRQALKCIEHGLYKPAYVMAWAAFVDFFHQKLAEDSFAKLRLARPKWKLASVEDLREQADYQMIDAAFDVGMVRKQERKALHGLLNRRNECAHPEDFNPGLNESLGYVSELLRRVETVKARSLI